jgi:branched-chain amino acid transport system substrate-binding protein
MEAMRLRHARRMLVAALAAALLTVTACTSSGGGAGQGSTTGEPILIGSSGPQTGQAFNQPEQVEGLTAAVAAVNAAGGVNGRPLKLEFCDGKFDPNAEINCARQLVAKKVVAAIDPNFTADASGTAFKILADAGIPYLSRGGTPATLTAQHAFLVGGGIPAWYTGSAIALLSAGATTVSILVGTSPSAQATVPIVERALDKAGKRHQTVVFDPNADPTGETAAAKAMANGADGIALAMSTSAIPVVLTALHRGGYRGTVAACNCIMTPKVVKALGPAAEGIRVVSTTALVTDTGNPGIQQYTSDLAAAGEGAEPKDISLQAWSSVKIFAELAKRMTTIDSTSVINALNDLSDPIDVHTIQPWAIKGKVPPSPDWPRVLNPAVQVGVIRNGVIQPDARGFVDPFNATSAG